MMNTEASRPVTEHEGHNMPGSSSSKSQSDNSTGHEVHDMASMQGDSKQSMTIKSEHAMINVQGL